MRAPGAHPLPLAARANRCKSSPSRNYTHTPAHAQLLYNVKQRNFPKELFEVRQYVLKPRG